MIDKQDACRIIGLLQSHSIALWLDGGWGVDALLGRQTREHNDLDLIVRNSDRTELLGLLRREGFREVAEEYTTANHLVWKNSENRIIDLHFIDFDPSGGILFDGETYPAGVLGGTGRIGTCEAACIGAEAQVIFHCGYVHDKDDAADVRVLCETFGIPVPAQYLEESGRPEV